VDHSQKRECLVFFFILDITTENVSDIMILLFLKLEVKKQTIVLKLVKCTQHWEYDNPSFLSAKGLTVA
jgi:hypothetical protein